jgi:uncharacterized surface protein with fasciclin (FAS1) repeats
MQIILSAHKSAKMSNIMEVVLADKNLVTMLRGVKAAGLETALSSSGPFTVFAPTNLAFKKLDGEELIKLLKPENKIQLTDMLEYHVVQGKKKIKDLKDGQKLKTINGKELFVKVTDDIVTIIGSKVQERDNEASNGVVHYLDTVLAN